MILTLESFILSWRSCATGIEPGVGWGTGLGIQKAHSMLVFGSSVLTPQRLSRLFKVFINSTDNYIPNLSIIILFVRWQKLSVSIQHEIHRKGYYVHFQPPDEHNLVANWSGSPVEFYDNVSYSCNSNYVFFEHDREAIGFNISCQEVNIIDRTTF